MDALFQESLSFMESVLRILSKQVPPPQRVPWRDSFVYRHKEKLISQAIIQKLARTASCLQSARILRQSGQFQEQGALQRMLDEYNEDIIFLSYGMKYEITSDHQYYLGEFFKDEFDDEMSSIKSTQKRGMLPRRKIRAYVARVEAQELDQSTGVEVSRTLQKGYSGYVHAASTQIMDMYFGDPPRFHVFGMLGTKRESEYGRDLWNYFFRGIHLFGFASLAFGDQGLFQRVILFLDKFEAQSGTSYGKSSRAK